jgi:hypothetical protein
MYLIYKIFYLCAREPVNLPTLGTVLR